MVLDFCKPNPDVYAAGDVIGKPELETVAAKEGNHAVRNAFGEEAQTIDDNAVPSVVYTSPEIAAVGTTELEYMEEHGTCSCRTVQMDTDSKSRVVNDTRAFSRSSLTTKPTRSSVCTWSGHEQRT